MYLFLSDSGLQIDEINRFIDGISDKSGEKIYHLVEKIWKIFLSHSVSILTSTT